MSRPKLSPEERKALKLAREQGEREQERRWPGFALNEPSLDIWGQISIEGGDRALEIRICKKGEWERVFGCSELEFRVLPLSLRQTLHLIHALAVRYNAAVEEMNRVAASIVVPEIRVVPQVTIDRYTDPGAAAQ